jgi:hypothetical protein
MVLVILDRTAQLAVDRGAAQGLRAMSLAIERNLANLRRLFLRKFSRVG